MLLKSSQESMKKILQYVSYVPFAKNILHRLNELARGKSIVFFTLHQVIEQHRSDFFKDMSLTIGEVKNIVKQINAIMPFISMKDALSFLTGTYEISSSRSVLVLEIPYLYSIKSIIPLLDEMHVPLCIMVSSESVLSGQLPWMDDVLHLFLATHKASISVSYIDRAFPLTNNAERETAVVHLIDHLSHCHPKSLEAKLAELHERLDDSAVASADIRIASLSQLKELKNNQLISFGSAGHHHWPLNEIDNQYAHQEIYYSKELLTTWFNESFVPVYYYPFGSERRVHKNNIAMIYEAGYQAAISRTMGVAHPGDNMYRLPHMSLTPTMKNISQYQLLGLSSAIDEFLLVTFGKEKEL